MPKRRYNPATGKLTSAPLAPPPTTFIHTTARNQEPESYIEWANLDRVSLAIRAARRGATQPLFSLYRDIILSDAHIQGELSKRKLAVIGDPFRIVPYEKDNAADIQAAQLCERQILDLPYWRKILADLLDGVLWPVAISQKRFQPTGDGGFRIAAVKQIPHYLLDYSEGNLRILDTDHRGHPLNTSRPPDLTHHIVHRGHMLSAPDQFGGPMRSLLYWWLCSSMSRDWWVRFLERYGAPFLVGKYEPGNESDRNIILGAMSQATRTFGIAVSANTEIDIMEATKSGADAYERFMAVAQREKSKLILGQTLSTQTDSTGLGSGVAALHGEVRDDIRQLDSALLSETLRDQLLRQICAANRLPGRPPHILFGKASVADTEAIARVLREIDNAGLRPTDDALELLSDQLGFGIERTPPRPFGGGSAAPSP